MNLAVVYSRASASINAPLVTVETHISPGFPGLNIVGLPEAAVKESKHRIRSALLNSQLEFPRQRITINLAPADLPKEGGRFDLPIALGILAASGQIPGNELSEYEFVGELALSGELRFVHGVLPIVLSAKHEKRKLIIPESNALEAAIVKNTEVYYAKHILDVCAHLRKRLVLESCADIKLPEKQEAVFNITDVRGQAHAKRALEIAAAGKHSLLFIGPPGTGKTMLASRLPGILPPLSDDEALESAAITSISSNGFNFSQWEQVPFRAPHHSSSSVALVGGGRPPKPGEISLAHRGVLFLDELPEYGRIVLESLREPLESGHITISRAAYQTVFPAQFQLIAAMNPCPCGHFGNALGNCQCTSEQVQRYLNKLSGPLLDRIDMQIEVPSLPLEVLTDASKVGESSEVIKARVLTAREKQKRRQQGKLNHELMANQLESVCELDATATDLIRQVMKKRNLSARVYHRILRVARTIADLADCDKVSSEHLSEALSYRCLDRA